MLIKKDVEFVWLHVHDETFEKLKKAISAAQVLLSAGAGDVIGRRERERARRMAAAEWRTACRLRGTHSHAYRDTVAKDRKGNARYIFWVRKV